MARPIDPTPVLSGKSALRFLKAAQNPQPYTPPKVDMNTMEANVRAIMNKLQKNNATK